MSLYNSLHFFPLDAVNFAETAIDKLVENIIYADQAIGDDANIGSFIKPVKSLRRALELAPTKSIIMLAKGNYDVSSASTALKSDVLVMALSYQDEFVTFDGLLTVQNNVQNLCFHGIKFIHTNGSGGGNVSVLSGAKITFKNCNFDASDNVSTILLDSSDISGSLSFYECKFNNKSVLSTQQNSGNFLVWFIGLSSVAPSVVVNPGYDFFFDGGSVGFVEHLGGKLVMTNVLLTGLNQAKNAMISSAPEDAGNVIHMINISIQRDEQQKDIIGSINKQGECLGFYSSIMETATTKHVLNKCISMDSSSSFDSSGILALINKSLENITTKSLKTDAIELKNVNSVTGFLVSDGTGMISINDVNIADSVEHWTGRMLFGKKIMMFAKQVVFGNVIPPIRNLNIDCLISYSGCVDTGQGLIPLQSISNEKSFISFMGTMLKFGYNGSDSDLLGKNCVVILEYTKKN